MSEQDYNESIFNGLVYEEVTAKDKASRTQRVNRNGRTTRTTYEWWVIYTRE